MEIYNSLPRYFLNNILNISAGAFVNNRRVIESNFPYSLLVQGARMEERLDDAINVLRNHAESQLGLHLGPVGPHGAIYSHTSPPQLDHMVRVSRRLLKS